MDYKIDYAVPNRIDAPELGCTSLECEVGVRFDRFIENRVSGRFAIREILREAEDAFRDKLDDEYGHGLWRSEFWGKLVLSACRVARYKNDPDLAEEIRASAYRVLSCQDADGYLGTYYNSESIFAADRDKMRKLIGWGSNFNWNVWGRKYTLWALLECAELFCDELILNACRRIADNLIATLKKLGVRLKDTGVMDGMPACSILKPMLILYRLTGEEKYYALCKDIIKDWQREDGERPNLLTVVHSGKDPNHWFSPRNVEAENGWCAKAYEMMSCFDGILEYYRVSGEKICLDAAIALYDQLIKYESNILGSVGYCEHFANAVDYPDSATEICDAIHWMRLCYELFRLTGEARYMESFEKAFLNAFLAGVFPESYRGAFFVRSAGRHWTGLPQCETKYQHCCTDNVPRGFANAAEAAVMFGDDGYYVNLYTASVSHIGDTLIHVGDSYINKGMVFVTVRNPEPGKKLFLRIPAWSRTTKILQNGVETTAEAGTYFGVTLEAGTNLLRISFDMSLRIYDFEGEFVELARTDYHVNRWCDDTAGRCGREQMCTHPMATVWRGPVLLARSKRVGCTEEEMFGGETVCGKERTASAQSIRRDNMLALVRVNLSVDGQTKELMMCDFASAANFDSDDVRYFSVFI